jgi:hypothetical protein
MGILVVKCPATGKTFSTGILTDIPIQQLPDKSTSSKCPHCGGEHAWRPREAALLASLPPSEWIENQK